MKLRNDDARDRSQLEVRDVVTLATLYDVLVDGAVLYPMDFEMDYWTKTTAYRPGWQSRNGFMNKLRVKFTYEAQSLESSSTILTSIEYFSGVLTWTNDLLKCNMSFDNTQVYEDVKE